MRTLAPGLRIRRAALADLATLATLEAAAFADPWEPAAVQSLLEQPGTRAWLASGAEEDAAGFALFRVVAAAREAELLRVATAPAWRRQGVAAGLLEIALLELDRESIACFLEVRADNRPAQELYRGLGFVVSGRRPAYYRDGCDAWLYSRPA